jgi:hypothetical protein
MLRSAPHHLELARCAFTKSQPLDDHFILIEPAWLLGLYHRLGGSVRITLKAAACRNTSLSFQRQLVTFLIPAPYRCQIILRFGRVAVTDLMLRTWAMIALASPRSCLSQWINGLSVPRPRRSWTGATPDSMPQGSAGKNEAEDGIKNDAIKSKTKRSSDTTSRRTSLREAEGTRSRIASPTTSADHRSNCIWLSFEGALNLPSLGWPLSRPRDPALFVPALLDRPSAEWWQVKE